MLFQTWANSSMIIVIDMRLQGLCWQAGDQQACGSIPHLRLHVLFSVLHALVTLRSLQMPYRFPVECCRPYCPGTLCMQPEYPQNRECKLL